MIREKRERKYHTRIPLPRKTEMVHKSRVAYSRKGKQDWKYQKEEEENSMSKQAKWIEWCKDVLVYIDMNEETYKFSDDQSDEVRFFANEGVIRDQGRLMRQLDEISIIIRTRMQDSRMSDKIQGYIDMMTRPAGLQ